MIGRRDQRDLTGLVAVVTGGARGIGEATARRLAAAGARVAIGDRDAEQVGVTAARLGVLGAPLDVTSASSWQDFLGEVAHLGPIDVLVNNAGIMPLGRLLEEPPEVTRLVLDVNLHGVVLGIQAVAPAMAARGRGHVVNLASAVGRVPAPGGASYTASKHAVVGLTDAVRQELAPYGVDVTMVLPTITRTRLAQGVAATPGIPPQTPEDVARVIEEVLRRPVAEAWVPRWAQPIAKVGSVLPRRLQDAVGRAFKADRVLVDVDGSARAGYEEDVRRHGTPG